MKWVTHRHVPVYRITGAWRIQQLITVILPVMILQGAVVSQATGGLLSTPDGRGSPAMAQVAADTPPGRSLYYQICAPCHGQDAAGGGPVPNLKEFQGTEEKFLQISLNGRSDRGMPPWKGKLSEDELRSILAFIQTLPK